MLNNSYILQIDTATEICSVSLSSNGVLLAEKSAKEANMHASALTTYIDQLLAECQVTYENLSAVAVSMGPGSYTGLRIGVSTAKGLCYALDIPLLGINTLESMFMGYAQSNTLEGGKLYIPVLDARRMEVYRAVFNRDQEMVDPTAAIIVEADTFSIYLPDHMVLFGPGAAKLQDLFASQENVSVDTSYVHSSAYMASLANKRLQSGMVEDLIYFEPFYLKEFVATTPKKLI